MFDDDDTVDATTEAPPKQTRVRLRDVLDEDGQPYRVGYKHPPLHSRFKKGQSGNPSGKRKTESGGLDIRSLVQDTFLTKVKVREAGKKTKRMPKIVALIKQKQQEAVKDAQAFRDILRIGEKFGVFNLNRKPKMKPSNMTPEQREAAAKAYLLLREAGLTKDDKGT
jgi:DNA segregation ATPase FtsK/SpoIIIE-like protein